MFAGARTWLRRHQTPIAIGIGVVTAGYAVGKYVVSKLNSARDRMSSERISRENLRRRFEQNQEDCTFTVLALLPTATNNVLEAMNTERITYEIQQMKGPAAAAGSVGSVATGSVRSMRSIGSLSPPSLAESATNATDDDGRSTAGSASQPSDGAPRASQAAAPAPVVSSTPNSATDTTPRPEDTPPQLPQKPRRTKRQLWDDLIISAITRAYTLLYTLALLTMLTRIQLNLLGRRSYLSSVVSLATASAPATISLMNNDDAGGSCEGGGDGGDGDASGIEEDGPAYALYGTDFETNRKYLTFSWWLLNRGWVDVMRRVEAAVRRVFAPLSPRDELTYDAFARLTRDVRDLVEGSPAVSSKRGLPGAKWLPHLLPPRPIEDMVLRESGVLDPAPEQEQQQQQHEVSGGGSEEMLRPYGTAQSSYQNRQAPPTPKQSTTSTSSSSPSSAISLRRLLDETADLAESPVFSHVLTQLLDAGFAHLLDNKVVAGAFQAPSSSAAAAAAMSLGQVPAAGGGSGGNVDALTGASAPPPAAWGEDAGNRAVPLPKILSVLTRQAHVIGNGMPNEYLQAMEAVRDLEGFAAVVYSSNWEVEIAQQDREGGGGGMVAGARDARTAAVGAAEAASVAAIAAPSMPGSAIDGRRVGVTSSGTLSATGVSGGSSEFGGFSSLIEVRDFSSPSASGPVAAAAAGEGNMRESASKGASQVTDPMGASSMVMVDSQGSFESAWERATENGESSQQGTGPGGA